MKKKNETQSVKVASSNTLKTRVLKNKKNYTRKTKYKNQNQQDDCGSYFSKEALFI